MKGIENVHRLFALGFFFRVSLPRNAYRGCDAAINDAILFFSLIFPLISFEILWPRKIPREIRSFW